MKTRKSFFKTEAVWNVIIDYGLLLLALLLGLLLTQLIGWPNA